MVTAQKNTSHVDQKTSLQPQKDVAQYSPTLDSDLFKFDATIVFGEGPVRPILLPHEVSYDQSVSWENHKRNPLKYNEPNFWLMQQPRHLSQLTKIDIREDIGDEEKDRLKEAKIMEWQRTGWFGLKQWGRQNALAAGCALYTGLTKEIILSGGRTKSKWTRENMPLSRLELWPSEAELMADIIVRYYGKLYEKRYKRPIAEVITLEDKATNTLENFAYTINKHPDLLVENKRIGFLTAKHHLKRVGLLAQIFSIRHADESKLCAQDILARQPIVSEIETEEDILEEVKTFQDSQVLKELEQKEAQLIRGLVEPQYLTYWFGYLGDVKHPSVLQKAMQKLNEPQWSEVAREVFQQLGLNIHEYTKQDMCELSQRDPNKYFLLVEGLKKLKKPEYRRVPQLQI